ncbi:hypothetical protein BOBR111200_19210 [Bordetella bronchialis]
MLGHQPPNPISIPRPRRLHDRRMYAYIRFPEAPLRPCRRIVLEHRQLPQHLVDQLACKPQKRIRIRQRQDIVEVQILLALRHHIRRPPRRRIAALDAMAQGLEIRLGQIRYRPRRQLRLQQLARRVDIVDRHFLEKQIVLHQLESPIQRHLHDPSATRRPRADRHQPLHLQRLQRLSHRALAHREQLLQLVLARQLIARPQIAFGNQPLNLLRDQIGALGSARRGGRLGGGFAGHACSYPCGPGVEGYPAIHPS